ncbi:hypothetical protein [Bacteroides sp.]|uniref:hypothetical protein n=1 Tax=Bacteroides sp. TaxID=29523 RepID=UPI00261EFA1A|nr:hypothetical protein [Bacteroides sp.]MDD3038619.1 hypothetical protein [Bacteroides sp.]
MVGVDADFSDVDAFFQQGKSEVIDGMKEEGEEFVRDAQETGNYQDHTKLLRTSNKYEVDESGLTLKNDAPYASFVEAKGFEVAGSPALRTETRCKKRFEK